MCRKLESVDEAISLLKSGRVLFGESFDYIEYHSDDDMYYVYTYADCDMLIKDYRKYSEGGINGYLQDNINSLRINYEDD